MSVGTGPQSAGMPQHGSMQQQQGQAPPPAGAHQGPQSQQNLNQIVSESRFLCLLPVTALLCLAWLYRRYARFCARDPLGRRGPVQLERNTLPRIAQL